MMWALAMYVTYTALREYHESDIAVIILVILFAGSLILSAMLTPTSYDKTIIKEHTKEVVSDPEKMKATLHLCVHHPKEEKCDVKILHKKESIEDVSLSSHEIDLDFMEMIRQKHNKLPRFRYDPI